MHLDHLWLDNFRNYKTADLEFAPEGLTVVAGGNGQGKTNLIEAVGYSATLRSFRGAASEALVGWNGEQAVVRGQGNRAGRELLVEAEINSAGRSRSQVNRQPFKRSRDGSSMLMATFFGPDDLSLVKGGPSERRRYLDELLSDSDSRLDALQNDIERVLKQRNSLLRQASGSLTPEITTTLDVWDAKFASLGEQLGSARETLVSQLEPLVSESYRQLTAKSPAQYSVGLAMVTEWREADGAKGLRETLLSQRSTDVARGVTTIGPHRDELKLSIDSMPARTHASQGEQRTMSLALRMAGHALLTEVAGSPPILLLDDVFSELDENRASSLLEHIPSGQVFLTTASGAPLGASPMSVITIADGAVS